MDLDGLNGFFDDISQEAIAVVRAGAPDGGLTERRVAFMRYHGQGHEIEIPLPSRRLVKADIAGLRTAFEQEYSRQFSRAVPGMEIEILNWGVVVSSASKALEQYPPISATRHPRPDAQRQIHCEISETWRSADIYVRSDLHPGDQLHGPALIVEPQTTTYVSADFFAAIDGGNNIWLTRQSEDQT